MNADSAPTTVPRAAAGAPHSPPARFTRSVGSATFSGLIGPARQLRNGFNGFTLIELLVVISIIAILAALLLPTLSRATASGRSAVCRSILKQWAVGLRLYADDNEGFIARESLEPNGVTVNLWADVKHSLANDVWYNALPQSMGISRARDFHPGSERSGFYASKIFHCPSARFPKSPELDEVVFFSIAMNSKLLLSPRRTMRLDEIREPGRTVVFLDNRLPDEAKADPLQTSSELGQPSASANRLSARHNKSVQLAFDDGHVEAFLGSSLLTNGFAIFPQSKVFWTADPNRNPNVE